jgi:N-acetylglucosaminyl-diphospho-decaprenol L-rhamnosyltransferase
MALAVPPGGGSPHGVPPTPDAQLPAPRPVPAPPRAPRKAPPKAPVLTVVVVNFCQWRNTARLVRQLRRSVACRTGTAGVVVIDNHSPSHPLARRVRRLPGVTVRRTRRNLGFARAVNHGCRLTDSAPAHGRWVLLLNPDVTVPDGFLDDVLASLEATTAADPRAGVVGFRLRNPDGTGQASAGPFPTLASTVRGLFLPRSRRKCRHHDGPGRRQVPWVTGGCLLVRRDCLAAVGGLDENFFLYYEDVDFCWRAWAGGWSVWYDPTLDVVHHWPLHARRVPAPLRLMTRHALLTYARKHWPAWQSAVLGGLIRSEAAARRLLAGVRGDRLSAACYTELGLLVGDVRRGRADDARYRLTAATAHLDPIAAEQDGR